MQAKPDKVQPSVYFATFRQIEPIGGSLARAHATMQGLLALGCQVSHGYFKSGGNAVPLEALRTSHASFSWAPINFASLLKCDVLWVSDFWSMLQLTHALRLVDEVRRLKPGIRIVVDLSDVMLADSEGKDNAPTHAIAYLEATLLHAADCVGLVSEREKMRAIGLYGLDPGKIAIIPTYHRIREGLVKLRFAQRHAHVCMGGTTHPHNRRALAYALAKVWPHIRKADPAAELHIFGKDTDKIDLAAFGIDAAASGVRLIGAVDDFQATLAQYRVHLVPTVSGAGIKTKILDSLATGTPVVGTNKSLEGLPLQPGLGVYTADSPTRMASLCLRLLRDEAFWTQANEEAAQAAKAQGGLAEIERQCGHALEIALAAGNPAPTQGHRSRPHVFIFSPGGRSASTALQRILNSSGQIRIYGESHGVVDRYMKLIDQVGSLQRGVMNHRIIPHLQEESSWLARAFASGRHDVWYPNGLPDWSASSELLMRSFEALFPPDSDSGRCGFKEISVVDPQTLLDLTSYYHNAYLVFLFRNPVAQWRSIRSFGADSFWPYASDLDAFLREYQRLGRIYLQVHRLRPARTVFLEDAHLRDLRRLKSLFIYLRLSRLDGRLVGDSIGTSNPDAASEETRTAIETSPAWSTYEAMQVAAQSQRD